MYDKYGNALYTVAMKVLQNSYWAEDVIQESLVKSWGKIDQYSAEKGKLFTWLLNIVRNTAIDVKRSAKYKQEKTTESTDSIVHIAETGNRSPDLIFPALNKSVEKLDEKNRLIVELIYFQGYTHQQVSEEYDIPLGTVKSRLRIALKQLRSALGEKGWAYFCLLFNGIGGI